MARKVGRGRSPPKRRRHRATVQPYADEQGLPPVPVGMRYKAARTVERHPWWTLSSIASLAALWPIIFPLLALLAGYIDTPNAAKEREAALKTELMTKMDAANAESNKQIALSFAEIAKVHLEIMEHKASDARQGAGVSLQVMLSAVTVARNRVNECNIAKQEKGKRMTALEMSVCFQYEQEYEENKHRYESAQTSAMQTWRQQ